MYHLSMKKCKKREKKYRTHPLTFFSYFWVWNTGKYIVLLEGLGTINSPKWILKYSEEKQKQRKGTKSKKWIEWPNNHNRRLLGSKWSIMTEGKNKKKKEKEKKIESCKIRNQLWQRDILTYMIGREIRCACACACICVCVCVCAIFDNKAIEQNDMW